MLNDVGKENEKKKNNKNNFARAAHFFVHLFTVVACVPVRIFFSQPLIFTLLAATGRYKIFMLLFQRNSALSLALALCRSFSR